MPGSDPGEIGSRRLGRPIRLFLCGIFIQTLGGSIFSLMLNFYLRDLGFDEARIGYVNSAGAWALVLMGLPMGRLSDRWGRGACLLSGSLAGVAAALGVSATGDFAALVALSAARGVADALVSGNVPPFIAEEAPEERRVLVFSLESALVTVTGLFGNLAGGWLPHWFSARGMAPSQSTLLAGAAIWGLGVLPFFGFGLRRIHRPPPRTEPVLGKSPSWSRLLLPHALVGCGAGLTIPFLNIYVKDKFQLDFEGVGALFAASSVLTAAGMMCQPWLASRFGIVKGVLLSEAFSIPFLLILGFVPVLALVSVAMLVRNMLMNMATPLMNAFFMERAPKDKRSTLAVLAMISWNAGWAASTAFSGWARSILGADLGFKLMFALMALFYVASILTFYLFWARVSPDRRPAA